MIDLGAAYGTAKSGVGISSMGVLKPELIFKSIVPIIMAGILGIYGLIVAVILSGKSKTPFEKILISNLLSIVTTGTYTYSSGYKHLASGLCCGLSSLVLNFPPTKQYIGSRFGNWYSR
jgi:V-type H+-transporting ATPase proteolipid subunit